MISGYLVGERELVARVRAMGPAIDAEFATTTTKLGYELERRVKRDWLRGPRPARLGVVTGRLSSSIAQGAPDSLSHQEDHPGAHYYFVGTNVSYGARWELGFHGSEQVKSFTRTQSMAWGRPIAPRSVTVQAHTRNVNINPRPFLAPALESMKQLIIDEYSKAAKRAMQKALQG